MGTSYWPNHVFVFLLGVTEMNILLALTNIYGHELMKNPEFRKKLAKALLNNTCQLTEKGGERGGQIKSFVDHELMLLPAGGDVSGARMVKYKTPCAQ